MTVLAIILAVIGAWVVGGLFLGAVLGRFVRRSR